MSEYQAASTTPRCRPRFCCSNRAELYSAFQFGHYYHGTSLVKQNKSPFKWRHFEPTIILPCVRWYCRYQLSYRDLEEMMRERGLTVGHVTIFRWVQRYAPEALPEKSKTSPLVEPQRLAKHMML